MKRDMPRLQEIATQLERRIALNHPGLAAVVVLFDSGGEADRPMAIMLHGVHEEEGLRILRRTTDTIAKAQEEGAFPKVETAPLIVKPH